MPNVRRLLRNILTNCKRNYNEKKNKIKSHTIRDEINLVQNIIFVYHVWNLTNLSNVFYILYNIFDMVFYFIFAIYFWEIFCCLNTYIYNILYMNCPLTIIGQIKLGIKKIRKKIISMYGLFSCIIGSL